jgi:hypothetical protein
MSWLNTSWEAHPDWYDFLHQINFENKQLTDGGGQCIQLICKFDWEIQVDQQTENYEWGFVRMSYSPDPKHSNYWPRRLDHWQLYSPWIKYKITKGRFLFHGPFAYERQCFTKRVEFADTIFPAKRAQLGLMSLLEPATREKHLIFYGEPNLELCRSMMSALKPLKVRLFRKRVGRWEDKQARRLSQFSSMHETEVFETIEV